MKIKNKAYQLYKLDWLASHGYTMEDIVAQIADICLEGDFDTRSSDYIQNILWDFEERGFNGEIYAHYCEFLDNEYHDKDYMRKLLNYTDYIEYLVDVEED